MWDTSKTPAVDRVARCSALTEVYSTGISQPANGTRRAPAATWRSKSGVRLSAASARATPARLAVPFSGLRTAAGLLAGEVLLEEHRDARGPLGHRQEV